jgi:hypothetical protein
MINHRCSACGHWHETSDHLIGMSIHCRECGEPVDVPAKSMPGMPHATKPSRVAKSPTAVMEGPDDPLDEGPVEAGWHRLQEGTMRVITRNPKGALVALALGAGLVFVLLAAAVGWWLWQAVAS